MKTLKLLLAAAAMVAATAAMPAEAQTYPNRPVRIIMPYPTGTGPDTVMRLVNEKLQAYWGQPITIENRPGANYWTAAEAAKRAAPDGYTLFQTENFMMGLQPHVFKSLPFDPNKDFDPVAPLYTTYFFLTVPANSQWRNVPDLFAAARSNTLSYGSSGVASHMHIGGAMLEGAAGAKMTHVPVRETPQVFTSIGNGEISFAFGTAGTTGPMLRANRVKYLAIAAPSRNPNFPDVPTVAEAGGPANFEVKAWIALYAPAGTPRPIVDKINADVRRALSEPDVRERMTTVGFMPWLGSPADLARTLEEDSKLLREVARTQNISLD